MIPTSLNVYRGQTDQGIGEAGTPIRRGEQFIAADAPLQADPNLLHAIRDWLTLDATTGDQGRLQERLAGWSCFPRGPYYFVCRLSPAGKYDRREAYFAHGRAWPLTAFAADFDPGLYLGNDAAFLSQVPDTAVALPPATAEPLDPILTNPGLTVSLIAHLFHGMVTGYPVIMAVPLTDFTAAAPLARIVAFARGALPGRLRRRCRIRLFSRNPQRFLETTRATGDGNGDRADLLVIPEELAVAALTAARRRALLLDAQGERRDGPEPAAGLLDYARAVLDSARRFPAHLTAFGERFDQFWTDPGTLPGPEQTHWVTLTYNTAVALAGTEAQCGSLFANYLLNQARAAAQLPWAALFRTQDWARFPQDPLIRFILRADEDRSVGERHLQDVLTTAFQERGVTLDAGLAAWWDPSDPGKRDRLLELGDLTPPVITAEQSAGLIRTLLGDDLAALPSSRLAALAQALLAHPRVLTMADLSTRLSARLQHQPHILEALADDLERAVETIDAAAFPERVLDLAGLLARTRPARTADLQRRFWTATDALAQTPDPAGLLAHGLAGRWTILNLDALMRQEPATTTALLIRHNAWLDWRHAADRALDQEARRALAMHWMTSPSFAELRTDAAWQRPPQWRRHRTAAEPTVAVDTTLETWHQVLDDLGRLTPDDCRLLGRSPTHWPWIHPFQWDQSQALAARCDSLEALAELVASLVRTAGADSVTARLWQASGLPERQPDATLDGLRDAVSELLEPGIAARRAQAAWVDAIIAALAGDSGENHALDALRQRLANRAERGAETHPLLLIAQAIRALPVAQRAPTSPLMAHGWNNLRQVIAGASTCYDWALLTNGQPILPLFHVAAILRPQTRRQAGGLARWLIHQPAIAGLRVDQQWWQGLLGSVLAETALSGQGADRRFKPPPEEAEATRQAALGLIDAERDALPETAARALACAWHHMQIDFEPMNG
ncbi:hypothetical protein [uncultured Lamprocystis sp.]|uniref:hypothetical protein n=1 Tax=uncultured Lamprocystis sp. TaxID=543132 RepID=UPI0025E0EF1B|nr:hypothetical protein [uncultured Lamprocystis sp.]